MGLEGEDIGDLYNKVKQGVAFRGKWAEQRGFGYKLPLVLPNVPKAAEKTEAADAAFGLLEPRRPLAGSIQRAF